MRTRRCELAAALVCLAVVPSTALAFKRTTASSTGSATAPGLFWRSRQVPFTLNDKGSKDAPGALTAARASFQVWSAPGCTDLTFQDQGVTSRRDVGYDPNSSSNQNLIVWREKDCADPDVVPANDPCLSEPEGACANQYGCWEYSAETIGLTLTTFSQSTGELFDADIEMNGSGFVFSTVDSPVCAAGATLSPPLSCVATDVANTLVHEIGHFIGLDHVSLPDSTMYQSAAFGEIKKRSLAQDDIDGLCTIYPRGQPTPGAGDGGSTPSSGSGGCGCGASGGPLGLLGLLGAAGLPALLRRRPMARPASRRPA